MSSNGAGGSVTTTRRTQPRRSKYLLAFFTFGIPVLRSRDTSFTVSGPFWFNNSNVRNSPSVTSNDSSGGRSSFFSHSAVSIRSIAACTARQVFSRWVA